MIGGCVGDLAGSSAAEPSVNSSAPTETLYRGYTIRRQTGTGTVSIYKPDGTFILAGRLDDFATKALIDNIAAAEART